MKIPLLFASDPYGQWRKPPFSQTNAFRPCIALYLGGQSGATKCKIHCEHCFIPQKVEALSPLESKRRVTILEKAGYNVVPMLPDTFADNGNYLRAGLLFHNRLYDQDVVRELGVAWTSGLPLLQSNWRELLGLASLNELKIIAITCHGLDSAPPFFKGGISPDTLRECIKRIRTYNREVGKQDRLLICLTMSIGNHNGDDDTIYNFFRFAAQLRVDYVRLNRLIDFSIKHIFKDKVMSKNQTVVFFQRLKNLDLPKSFIVPALVSSDMGICGPAVIGQNYVSGCQGGIGLFAILGNKVFPCIEYLDEALGDIDWSFGQDSGKLSQNDPISWNHSKLLEYRKAIDNIEYDGCMGHLLTSIGNTSIRLTT